VNRLGKFAALSTLSAVLFSGAAFAQNNGANDHHDASSATSHDNHAYVQHSEWKKGAQMKHEDWGRGEPVDYRTNHLKAPARGYEWRQVDGNYVMGGVSTGSIRVVVAAPRTR
jgi:Ni/Co efflux regulator RcnB